MAKKDYYEVLGVPRQATQDDVKKAYRKLAIQYHPDRNPDDSAAEESFKEATEAYEVLADTRKRQAYDQFGFAGVEGAGGVTHEYSDIFEGFEDIFGDVGSIFESFFGGTRGRRRSSRHGPRRGADLRFDLELPFVEAIFGTKAEVSYARSETCTSCNGSGGEGGSGRKLCPGCGGSGQVRRSSGFFSIATTCPTCQGEGEIVERPCEECRGVGTIQTRRRLKVTIPPGIESGKRIAIPDQGDAGSNSGPFGNLYVYVHVQPHEYFERSGTDLYCMVPVSITQAALGTELQVVTLQDERVTVKVPSGTQNGRIIRVKGEGVPYMNNSTRRGDLYVKLRVNVPSKLSSRAKELLRELASLNGENDSPEPIALADIRER